MKCIKNVKSGQVMRVTDKIAENTIGREWVYVPKSEWKTKPVLEEVTEQTIAEKQLKRKKTKK
jgi:hypothetical protein